MSGDDDAALSRPGRLEILDRDACIELLAHHGFVGRLGFIVERRPIILPVNFVMDDDSVVFCTADGTKLNAVIEGADVAFEVDESVPLHHSGWSVLVQGRAELIRDPAAVARLRRGPLLPWAQGARANWIRISLDKVSGRRIPEL